MTTPSGPDQNYPQGGAPQGQPGWSANPQPGHDPQGYNPQGYNAPGYNPAPSYSGAPAPTGQRPGMVTAAAIVGVVWGGLGALFGLLGLLGVSALEELGIRLSGLDIILGILGIAVAVVLLVGGIQVLQGKAPTLLLYGAYATAGLWLLTVIANLVQGYGFAGAGILSLVIAGVIIALLFNQQSRQYFASRGITY